MKHQIAIQQLLRNRMEEAKTKNPAFSLRAFSKKIGLSHTMTSRVLSGKRQVSITLARKIAETLMLDPQEASELLSLFPSKQNSSSTLKVDPIYLQLSSDQHRMIGEWHYFAILSLLKTRGFQNSPIWIAGRLGLPASAVKQALERLKRLGVLTEGTNGKLKRSKEKVRTSDDVANLSLRKAHFSNLDLGRRSLESDPIEMRDFSSLTLAFSTSRMREAKQMIRKFQDEFDAEFEGNEKSADEVYRLCAFFIPLTRTRNEDEL